MEDSKETSLREIELDEAQNVDILASSKLDGIVNPKLGTDGIILVPQPSDDADDPLVTLQLHLPRKCSEC
jgi:hypothetical protein